MDQWFAVKISDYTLRDLRSPSSTEFQSKKKIWIAPEVLNHTEKPDDRKSSYTDSEQKADIYSLGIIMMEMVWLADPVKPDRHWTVNRKSAARIQNMLGFFLAKHKRKMTFPNNICIIFQE